MNQKYYAVDEIYPDPTTVRHTLMRDGSAEPVAYIIPTMHPPKWDGREWTTPQWETYTWMAAGQYQRQLLPVYDDTQDVYSFAAYLCAVAAGVNPCIVPPTDLIRNKPRTAVAEWHRLCVALCDADGKPYAGPYYRTLYRYLAGDREVGVFAPVVGADFSAWVGGLNHRPQILTVLAALSAERQKAVESTTSPQA